MSDTTIFYLLGFLGIVAHTVGKLWRRDGTVRQWLVDNDRYLFATLLATFVVLLIGPGDDAALGTIYARTCAFTAAATGCEAIRAIMLGPPKTAERKRS